MGENRNPKCNTVKKRGLQVLSNALRFLGEHDRSQPERPTKICRSRQPRNAVRASPRSSSLDYILAALIHVVAVATGVAFGGAKS